MGLGHVGARLLFISLGILGLIAVIIAMTATSTDQKIPAWIAKLVPGRGNGSLQDGIKCYGLPYGAIGFVSHILTYCTIFSLDLSRSPAKLVWNIIGKSCVFSLLCECIRQARLPLVRLHTGSDIPHFNRCVFLLVYYQMSQRMAISPNSYVEDAP